MAVEVVDVYATVAVELGNLEVGIWGEHVLEGLVEGVEEGEQLGRQDVLEDGEEAQERPHLRQYLHLNFFPMTFVLSCMVVWLKHWWFCLICLQLCLRISPMFL